MKINTIFLLFFLSTIIDNISLFKVTIQHHRVYTTPTVIFRNLE